MLRGGSLKAPAYTTGAPVWWSLLVHLLFLAFAVFFIAKDQNIRKVPRGNMGSDTVIEVKPKTLLLIFFFMQHHNMAFYSYAQHVR